MITLNGITWNHERGFAPLVFTSRSFSRSHPDVCIKWDKRSLKEYGDYPVDKLAQKYDIIMIDHPFVGEAYKRDILLDYNKCFDKNTLDDMVRQELGATYRCYNYRQKQLAFCIDAAAVTSVSRQDLLAAYKLTAPESFNQVIDFAQSLPTGKTTAAALCATDMWCLFLSFGAALSGADFITQDGIRRDAAEESLALIRRLLSVLDPRSIDWNPIQLLDEMRNGNSVLYAPYAFQYINYAWLDQHNHLQFQASPLWKDAKTGCILGGVGIAVSSHSKYPEQALEYVKYVTSSDVQCTDYFMAGGQPAARDAWLSDINNILTGNFFANTRTSIENAYVRPRFAGWNIFQEEGSELLHSGFKKGASCKAMENELYRLFCNKFLNS